MHSTSVKDQLVASDLGKGSALLEPVMGTRRSRQDVLG